MTRFDPAFKATLDELFRWRRDVRRFTGRPVAPALVAELLAVADLSPSVGLSRPWRFVVVDSPERRALVRGNFERCNEAALAAQPRERAGLYARMKLAGLDTAPIQIAVFTATDPARGHGLGRLTMPETVAFSTVIAVHTLWLAARARGLGLGWVSILDRAAASRDLAVPLDWRFVAYLCLGYPAHEDDTPALERDGWERRGTVAERVFRR